MRWVKNNGFDLDSLRRSSEIKKAKDIKDNPLLLFQNEWNVRMCLENNEGLELEEVK
jgi:peptide chain release factor 3